MKVKSAAVAAKQQLCPEPVESSVLVDLEWAGSGAPVLQSDELFYLQTRITDRVGSCMYSLQKEFENIPGCRHYSQVHVMLQHNGSDLTEAPEDCSKFGYIRQLTAIKNTWKKFRQLAHEQEHVVLTLALYPEAQIVIHYMKKPRINELELKQHLVSCRGALASVSVYLAVRNKTFNTFVTSRDTTDEHADDTTDDSTDDHADDSNNDTTDDTTHDTTDDHADDTTDDDPHDADDKFHETYGYLFDTRVVEDDADDKFHGTYGYLFDKRVVEEVNAALIASCKHRGYLLGLPSEFKGSVWFVYRVTQLVNADQVAEVAEMAQHDLHLKNTFLRLSRMK